MTQNYKIYTKDDFNPESRIGLGYDFEVYPHPEDNKKIIKIPKRDLIDEKYFLPIASEMCTREVLKIIAPQICPQIRYITDNYRNICMDRIKIHPLSSNKLPEKSCRYDNAEMLALESYKQQTVIQTTLLLRKLGIFVDGVPEFLYPSNIKNYNELYNQEMPETDYFTDDYVFMPNLTTRQCPFYVYYQEIPYSMHNFLLDGTYFDLFDEIDFEKLKTFCKSLPNKQDRKKTIKIIDDYLKNNPAYVATRNAITINDNKKRYEQNN